MPCRISCIVECRSPTLTIVKRILQQTTCKYLFNNSRCEVKNKSCKNRKVQNHFNRRKKRARHVPKARPEIFPFSYQQQRNSNLHVHSFFTNKTTNLVKMPITKKDRIKKDHKKAEAAGTRIAINPNGTPKKAPKATSTCVFCKKELVSEECGFRCLWNC